MKCKRLCAWLLCLVMMFSLLPVSAAAEGYDKHSVTVEYEFKDDSLKSKSDDVKETIPGLVGAITPTDETTPTGTSVYVYFKTVNTENELVKVESGVKYNRNKDDWYWATLGKLTTTKDVANASAADIGNEVKTSSNFVNHDSNKDFSLDLINKWADLKQENGADSYDDAPVGAWHLDGTVNVYKLSYDANLPDGVGEEAVRGMPDPAYYLPNWDAPVSTVAPTLRGYVFRGWYTEPACKHKVENTVTVTGDTDLYAKWTSRAQPNAYLIDDDITIKHGVNGAPKHGDDDDSTVHIVNKDAKISYQATLDMRSLEFVADDNPQYAAAVYGSETVMASPGTPSPWEFMMDKDITMFADSTVNLHVKFSDKLDTNNIDWSKLSLTSDWFRLADDYRDVLATQDGNGYWTIPCVIKAEKGTDNSSKITLSGVSLPLTPDAQGELNSDTALDITSEGYIDGTIKSTYTDELSLIGYTYELSLIGKSKVDPAKNTAKLKLATYTVTYHGNGANSGATTDTAAYARGTEVPVMANGYARDGHTFTGWNTKKDGSGTPHVPGSSIPVTDHIHLYAQWSENSSGGGGDDSKTYYYFAIEKVDAQDGHALNGAKFELYQYNSKGKTVNRTTAKTSRNGSESGIALFSVSATKTNEGGDTWYYREITAPEGYALDTKEYEISARDFYHDDQSKAVAKAETVRNYRGTTPDLLNGDDHFAYVVGYQDGCVHPNALITRAETATIFFRLLKDSVRDGNLLTSNTFADVPNDYWANTAISTMAGLGIVQGYNSTAFDPNASITRAEFAAICARFDTGKSSGTQTFSDIKGHWAEKYIERAAELGWIKGFEDGTFRPNDCITRAQAMTMINRVLNRIPEDASDLLPDMNVWPDCNPGDWFYLAVQEATNSHDFKHKAGNYETWTGMSKDPDWTRYEN